MTDLTPDLITDPELQPTPDYPLDAVQDRKAPRNADDLLRELRRAEVATTQRVTGLTEAGWRWRPPEGGWSAAQILGHLTKVNRTYGQSIEEALEKAPDSAADSGDESFVPRFVEGWFIVSLEPPPKMRVPAPRKSVPVAQECPPGDRVASDYRESLEDLRRLVERGRGRALREVGFPSPFFRLLRLSLGGGFAAIAAHERRHHLQLLKLLKKPGFPPAAETEAQGSGAENPGGEEEPR
ncbi:MAG: DinB family protein [Acidobacteriota bacterium]